MKNNFKITMLFIILGLALIIPIGIKFYNNFIKDNTYNKKISSIELYGYELTKNDTELYKSTFKELETALNSEKIDYELYAKLISKLFVIDVYNLDNKMTSTDIGGLEFIHEDLKENFKENMGATLYKYVESNINGDRTQELPKVTNVNVSSVFKTTYTYKDKQYDSYMVDVSWDYEKDLKYQKSLKLTIINDNKILWIVKGE